MLFQEFEISLTNGEKVFVSEPYSMSGPETLLNRYAVAGPEEGFCAYDGKDDYLFFKERNIVCIRTGDIKEIKDGTFKVLQPRKKEDIS